ncbi:MAG: phenylacetate--CoA ligase [Ruminococcaceae bacterium]|nr:phenylacetate--CoA ligase [Oscillospiraceae bacterium]
MEIRMWQREIETMQRDAIKELQLEKLKSMVAKLYRDVPHYKKKFDEAGVSPDDIKTLSDISKFPFTTKEDIRVNYPYGLFAKPLKEIVRIHASSGTTGVPTVVGYTRNDLNTWSDLVARIVVAAGVTGEDIAQISFGYGLFTGALGLHYGLEKIGATVVPVSSGNTERQINIMRDFGSTVLISTPTYAMYLAETAKGMGLEKGDLKLKIGLLGSEGCSDEFRDEIEEKFGIFPTDNYGLSEIMGPGISGECVYREGMHIAEDHFLAEIIDPVTEEVLPMGSTGELVLSSLTREGIPLLRYRTKDITTLIDEPCRCGRTHTRMTRTLGRSDDMLKVKGVNVFPTQIESAIVGIEGIGSHYLLILRRENYMDNLEVKVELVDGKVLESYGELEKIQMTIKKRLLTILGLDAKVTLCSPMELERFTGKAKRVLDLRFEKEGGR